MTDLTARLKKALAFDGKAASDQFEKMRREKEIGDEAFVASGYYCHDAIIELARWQSARTHDLLLALVGVTEVAENLWDADVLGRQSAKNVSGALSAVLKELEKLEGGT